MTRLGIHTEVPDPSQPNKTHAWISVEKDGVTKTYSLYDNENTRAYDNGQSRGWNGSGTHVRESVDLDKIPTASRFKEISPEQEQKLAQSLSQSEKYGTIHNNCSHFASKTWENTTGERLEVKHQAIGSNSQPLPAESPVGLEQSMRAKELEQSSEKVNNPSRPSLAEPERKQDQPATQQPNQARSQTAPEQAPAAKPQNPYSFDRADQQTTKETTNPYSHTRPDDGPKTR